MKYGQVNDLRCRPHLERKQALLRFSCWLSDQTVRWSVSEYADRPDLPIFIDEPGMWICRDYAFLAGSPETDGAGAIVRLATEWCMKPSMPAPRNRGCTTVADDPESGLDP